MARTPYLVKRGNMFWWRRRKPVFMFSKPFHDADDSCTEAGPISLGVLGHFAVSLRTTCPKEASRRAACMNLLFEEKRQSIETAVSRNDGMSDQSYLHRAVADMAATLRAQAEMLASQMVSNGPTIVAALPQEQAVHPTPTGAPPQAPAAAIGARSESKIDDPEFERAILEMADREGW